MFDEGGCWNRDPESNTLKLFTKELIIVCLTFLSSMLHFKMASRRFVAFITYICFYKIFNVCPRKIQYLRVVIFLVTLAGSGSFRSTATCIVIIAFCVRPDPLAFGDSSKNLMTTLGEIPKKGSCSHRECLKVRKNFLPSWATEHVESK